MVKFENLTGRLSSGELKYKKIKYRKMYWKDLSKFVRERDKKCLKCGSINKLQADHFHPQCYIWKKQFFNPHKIQTLCKVCHNRLPSMKERSKIWREYCYRKEVRRIEKRRLKQTR